MKKELEALKRVVGCINNYTLHGLGEDNWLGIQDVLKDVSLLEKALTPPTKEEVCKALSEYLGRNVYYEKRYFLYRKEEFYNQPFIIAYKYKSGLVELTNNVLPPHLITLIGRFYQSLEEENV